MGAQQQQEERCGGTASSSRRVAYHVMHITVHPPRKEARKLFPSFYSISFMGKRGENLAGLVGGGRRRVAEASKWDHIISHSNHTVLSYLLSLDNKWCSFYQQPHPSLTYISWKSRLFFFFFPEFIHPFEILSFRLYHFAGIMKKKGCMKLFGSSPPSTIFPSVGLIRLNNWEEEVPFSSWSGRAA